MYLCSYYLPLMGFQDTSLIDEYFFVNYFHLPSLCYSYKP